MLLFLYKCVFQYVIYIYETNKQNIFYYSFSDLCYETDIILKYLKVKHILYFCCHSKHKMGFKLVVVAVVDLNLDIQNRALLVICEHSSFITELAYMCTCNCFS